MKVCDYCGRENDQDAACCRECGTQKFRRPGDGHSIAHVKTPMTTRECWSYGCCTMVLLCAMGLYVAGHDRFGTTLAMAAISFASGVAKVNGRLTRRKEQQQGSNGIGTS